MKCMLDLALIYQKDKCRGQQQLDTIIEVFGIMGFHQIDRGRIIKSLNKYNRCQHFDINNIDSMHVNGFGSSNIDE